MIGSFFLNRGWVLQTIKAALEAAFKDERLPLQEGDSYEKNTDVGIFSAIW